MCAASSKVKGMFIYYSNSHWEGLLGLFYSSGGMTKINKTSGKACPSCLTSEKVNTELSKETSVLVDYLWQG